MKKRNVREFKKLEKPAVPAPAAGTKLAPGHTVRCDEVLVAMVLREYDAQGNPVGEQQGPPQKIFRSKGDLWATVDGVVAELLKGR